MKYITRFLALCVFVASCTIVVYANPITHTYSLYTVQSFTELLISRGIVPQPLADKARTFARMITRADAKQTESVQVLNADKVEVSVSQTIDQANLQFQVGKDITGPVLLVKNATTGPIMLEAKRRCQIVYHIYNDKDVLVYDSATSAVCETNERVTYSLQTGQVRMFPVRHKVTDYALGAGTYRMELEYPGYGKGSVIVTVL